MANEQALEYIRKQRGFGMIDGKIRDNAIRGGFTPQEVDEAFKDSGGMQAPPPPPVKKMPVPGEIQQRPPMPDDMATPVRKRHTGSIIFLVVILAVAAIAYILQFGGSDPRVASTNTRLHAAFEQISMGAQNILARFGIMPSSTSTDPLPPTQ